MSESMGATGEVFVVPRAEDCHGVKELFAALGEHERLEAVALSRKAELVAGIFDQVERLERSGATGRFPFSDRQMAVMEFSPALGVSSYKAGEFVDFAEHMTKLYPKLGALLAKAGVTANTARHVHKALKEVPAHLRFQLDSWLESQTPKWRLHSEQKIKDLVQAQIIRLDADWAAEQREQQERKQGLSFKPIGAGMARMTAILPLGQAAAVKDALDQIANTTCPKDPREPWIRRKDALISAVSTTAAEHNQLRCECGNETCEGSQRPAPQAKPMTLIVNLEVLANLSDLPAWLDGSPIDPDLARTMAKAASRISFTTTPENYVPTAAVKTHVEVRYRHCRGPGCHRRRCDMDHTIPFDHDDPSSGGLTIPDNLKKLCRTCHRHKTHGGWRDEQLPDGTIIWISPLGQRYTIYPDAT